MAHWTGILIPRFGVASRRVHFRASPVRIRRRGTVYRWRYGSTEMICADFWASAHADNCNPEILLHSISRYYKFLPSGHDGPSWETSGTRHHEQALWTKSSSRPPGDFSVVQKAAPAHPEWRWPGQSTLRHDVESRGAPPRIAAIRGKTRRGT
jgi:hypothetical protein